MSKLIPEKMTASSLLGRKSHTWPLSREEAKAAGKADAPKLTDRQRQDAAYWHSRGGVPAQWVARELGVHRSVVVKWAMKLKFSLPDDYVPEMPEPQKPAGTVLTKADHRARALKSWITRRNGGVKRHDAGVWDTSQGAVPDKTAPPRTRETALAYLAATLAPKPGERTTVTLTVTKAGVHVTQLEHKGWRAETVATSTGFAYVEVRDMAVRSHPVIARLRTPEDVAVWNVAHPEHGLIGRVRTAPPTTTTSRRAPGKPSSDWPPLGSLQSHIGKWRTRDSDY